MTRITTLPGACEDEALVTYVTLRLDGQLIGLPIGQVKDVFQVQAITPVPLAHPALIGLTNLRGRIIMVFSLAGLMGLDRPEPGPARLAVGVTWRGETCGIQTTSVGDVIEIAAHLGEPPPRTLSPVWARHARRMFRLNDELMIELDVTSLLDMPPMLAA